jgi:hypothetical protein
VFVPQKVIATTYVSLDNETYVVGVDAPYPPYNFEYGVPSGCTRIIRQSANTNVSKYLEQYISASTDSFYYAVTPSGSPISLNTSTMYYLSFMVRFDRVLGAELFAHDFEANKGVVLMGGGTALRAGVGFGYWQWGNYISGKYSIIAKCNNSTVNDNYVDNTFKPNQNGYSETNNYPLDYERWYSVVFGITPSSSASGKVRLWVNGTLIVSYDDVITTSSASPVLDYIENGATIAQNDYNCPNHYENWDRLIFSNAITDIDGTGGTFNFFSDPEIAAVGTITGITITPGVAFK